MFKAKLPFSSLRAVSFTKSVAVFICKDRYREPCIVSWGTLWFPPLVVSVLFFSYQVVVITHHYESMRDYLWSSRWQRFQVMRDVALISADGPQRFVSTLEVAVDWLEWVMWWRLWMRCSPLPTSQPSGKNKSGRIWTFHRPLFLNLNVKISYRNALMLLQLFEISKIDWFYSAFFNVVIVGVHLFRNSFSWGLLLQNFVDLVWKRPLSNRYLNC